MRVGNDVNGYMNGSVTMDEVEVDLMVKALKVARNEPMCDIHEGMIDELLRQFEAIFEELTKISERELDNADEGWYNREDDEEFSGSHYKGQF